MKKTGSIVCAYDILVAVYCLFAIILSGSYGFKIDFKIIFHWQYDIIFISIALAYLVLHTALVDLHNRRNGEDSVLFGSNWRKKLKARYFHRRNLIDLIKVTVLLKITLYIYGNIKQAIPFINSNIYDPQLLFADRIVHIGLNPNTLTVKLLGNGLIAGAIDWIYISWYFVKPMVLVYFAIIPERSIHIRFFTSYFAMWIFGGISALLVPSMGPIYTNPEWFSGLNIPFANRLQQMLLNHYKAAMANPETYKVFIYEGIAAFPSLHIGIIALYTFFIWKLNRKVGIAMFVYVALLQIGSVFLGWHYAVDGYFATGLAYGFYQLSGKILPSCPVPLPGRQSHK